mgnify:CR=1 FL=1
MLSFRRAAGVDSLAVHGCPRHRRGDPRRQHAVSRRRRGDAGAARRTAQRIAKPNCVMNRRRQRGEPTAHFRRVFLEHQRAGDDEIGAGRCQATVAKVNTP